MSDEEEENGNGHTKVTVDNSEADPVAPSSGAPPEGIKCGGGGGGGGGGSVGGNSPDSSPPLREHSGSTTSSSAPSLPPRSDKTGRWPSFPRIWNRRKSMGAATAAPQDPRPLGGFRDRTGSDRAGGGGGGGGKSGSDHRAMAGRTASAPAMVGSITPPSSPSKTTARGGPGALGSLDDLACTPVVETETLEDVHPVDLRVAAGDSDGDGDAASEAEAFWTPTGTPSLGFRGRGPSESGTYTGEAEGEGEGGSARYLRQRTSSQGSITGPNPADVMSAPFLVARISGVGAELKDIMWSVKQTHFPYLKTAGSLQATLSGLTIELELDTQDLPAGGRRSKKHQGSGGGVAATEGLPDGGDGSGGCGGGGGGEPAGGSPTGLKLTRLRVSVLAVKVHVKNNALSAVYNLAATAFEAAVKRYVVDSVEAAVRRNVTSLLTIINTQLSQRWDVLCKVGGGASSENGESPRAGSAVEKVLAASLSHHLVWPAGSEAQVRGGGGGGGGGGGCGSDGGGGAAGPTGAKRDSVLDQRPTLERVASGSSRGSADSEDSAGGLGLGIGGAGSAGSAGTTATSVRKRLAKRSFRILGSIGKAQSTEELSKLSSSSSSSSTTTMTTGASRQAGAAAASSSSSLPPPPASSRRGIFARPPPLPSPSPTPPSQNSSSTTLSEGEAAPPAEWAGRRAQERRREGAAAGGFEKEEGIGGGFLHGVVGLQQDGGAGKYWKTSPTGSAILRQSSEMSVPLVEG